MRRYNLIDRRNWMGIHLITCGSSSSSGWLKIGVLVNADGCGRGAKGGAAPKVGFEDGDIDCYTMKQNKKGMGMDITINMRLGEGYSPAVPAHQARGTDPQIYQFHRHPSL